MNPVKHAIRIRGALALLLTSSLLFGCNLEGFNLGGNAFDGGPGYGSGDGGNGDGGGGGGDGGMPTDSGPICVPSPESCDEADNDCDGEVDENFNLGLDPSNCGECGNRCQKFGTAGICSTGDCQYSCLTGFIDLNDDIEADGCEYQCTPTSSTDECDLSDNDCDGEIDEDINITTDIDNCGGCGNLCRVLNATPQCVPIESDPIGNPGVFDDGSCTQGACNPGFLDRLPGVPGCEYACPVFPAEVETCDGQDDDCSGVPDDNLPPFDRDGLPDMAADNSCHPFLTDGNPGNDADAGRGQCNFGTWVCTGTLNCQGAGLPAAFDLCGGGDEDCDGNVDEDANTTNDPQNCGACGNACDLDNASSLCSASACIIAACDQGFVNEDGNAANGCEYECTPTGPEVCDGIDNDCDGDIDNDDATLINPGNTCRQIGPCATAAGGGGIAPICGVPGAGSLASLPGTCGTTPGWYCPYDTAIVSVNPTTCAPASQEAGDECDSLDNDCDGAADETFSNLGADCDDGRVGACRGFGEIVCAVDGVGTECVIDMPGQEDPADFESCNGEDDDCDNSVDEDAVDDMVPVTFTPAVSCTVGNPCNDASGTLNGTCDIGGATCSYWVDQYEASRPDASSISAGSDETIACSLEDKLPWSLVTQTEAAAACAANGKRLCSASEWQLACAGNPATTYPYGDMFDSFTCNTSTWNDECQPPGLDDMEQVFPTGFGYSPSGSPGNCDIAGTSSCMSDVGAFDMSGNLREWTASQQSGNFQVRGGSYNDVRQGATCSNDFIKLAPSNAFSNLGFRCCRSDEPPMAP